MKKSLHSLLFLFFSQSSPAQVPGSHVSMPSNGISAYGSGPVGFAFQNNVASLVHYENREVSLFSERRFLLSELQFFSAAIAWKMNSGGAGFSLDHHAFNGYQNSAVGAAYARKLGRVAVGLKFNYGNESVPGSRGVSIVSARAGMLVSVTPKLRFGWQVENFPAAVSKASVRVLPVYKAGVGFMASKDCLLGMEFVKAESFPVNVHASLCYTYRRRFFIRAGTQSASGSYYAGGGIALKKLQIHLSVSHHPYLGFSPGLLLNQKF